MSLTTTAFGRPGPRSWRVYFIVRDPQEVETALSVYSNHLVVLMFWAPWNELSKSMKTPFWYIAKTNRHEAIFCMLDVDKHKELAERYAAEALPTFVLIKNNEVKYRVVGAKEEELKSAIQDNK